MMMALQNAQNPAAAPLYAAVHSPTHEGLGQKQIVFTEGVGKEEIEDGESVFAEAVGKKEIEVGDNVFTKAVLSCDTHETQYNGELEWLHSCQFLEQLKNDEITKSVDVCRGLICVSERRKCG
jgi:hypothetical protein